MDHWFARQAYFEQHRDRMLQEAAKDRLIQQALGILPDAPRIPRQVVNPRIKLGLAYLVALAILVALFITQVVAAAAPFGGGGGHCLVM